MKNIILLISFLISFTSITARPNVHPDPEKAVIKLLSSIPLNERKRADDYTEGKHWITLWNFVNAALITWIFLSRALSEYIKKISAGNSLFFITIYFIVCYLLFLPLNIYQNLVREMQYGFLDQNFTQWFSEDFQKFIIEMILLVPFFLLGYDYMNKRKKDARIYGVLIPIVMLNIPLEYRILILSGFLMVRWIFNKSVPEYGMPFLFVMLCCYLLVLTPLFNSIKRRSQMNTDIRNLNIGRKPDLFIFSVLKSADREKVDPGFWEELFFFDHPSIKERILAAGKWKAENIIFLPFFNINDFHC